MGFARTWPPIVVVESASMTHDPAASSIGTMDTGDIVVVEAVSSRRDVVTYVEGRASGHSTYGDYGDVIVFRDPENVNGTPFIHRALAHATWNASADGYDVPDLGRLPPEDWDGWDASGVETSSPWGLSRFVLHRAGWRHDLDVYINLTLGDRALLFGSGEDGFLTMGDHNAYDPSTFITKFDRWVVPLPLIIGKSRGEIPWFGLIRLTLAPSPAGCCEYWGSTDPERGAAANSWAALGASVFLILGSFVGLTALELWFRKHPEQWTRLRSSWRRLLRRPKEGPARGDDEEAKKD